MIKVLTPIFYLILKFRMRKNRGGNKMRKSKMEKEMKKMEVKFQEIFNSTVDDKQKGEMIVTLNKSSKNVKVIIAAEFYNGHYTDYCVYDELEGKEIVLETGYDLKYFAVHYKAKKDKIFCYKIIEQYSSKYWKIIEGATKTKEKKYIDEYLVKDSMPIRWLGAFNTGAGGKWFSFEESLDWETSPKDRQVAAQLLAGKGELIDRTNYPMDTLDYCKVGVIYNYEDIMDAYDRDVWSFNFGPLLCPGDSNWDYDKFNFFEPYEMMRGSEEGDYKYEERKDEIIDEIANYILYDQESLYLVNIDEVVNDMFTENQIEWFKNYNSDFGFVKRIVRSRVKSNTYGPIWIVRNNSYHTEAFIRIGAKPQGIVVRGRITKKKYEIIKKIAVEKGLYILHV